MQFTLSQLSNTYLVGIHELRDDLYRHQIDAAGFDELDRALYPFSALRFCSTNYLLREDDPVAEAVDVPSATAATCKLVPSDSEIGAEL